MRPPEPGWWPGTTGAIHPELVVTTSAGLAGIDEAEPAHDLPGIADARLYTAKHAGRNRVFG